MLVPRTVFGLTRIADTESSRYALGGIYFTRDAAGNPQAAACDGRRLAVFSWPEEKAADCYPNIGLNLHPKADFAAILPVEACDKAAKLARPTAAVMAKKPLFGNVVIDEHAANKNNPAVPMGAACPLDFSPEKIAPRPLEGRYPAYRDVIPSYTPDNSHSIKIDPYYLADLCKVLADFGTDENAVGITLTIAAECTAEKPLVLSVARYDGRKAAAVLMPLAAEDCRDVDKPLAAVAWHPTSNKTAADLVKAHREAQVEKQVAAVKVDRMPEELENEKRKTANLEKRLQQAESDTAAALAGEAEKIKRIAKLEKQLAQLEKQLAAATAAVAAAADNDDTAIESPAVAAVPVAISPPAVSSPAVSLPATSAAFQVSLRRRDVRKQIAAVILPPAPVAPTAITAAPVTNPLPLVPAVPPSPNHWARRAAALCV